MRPCRLAIVGGALWLLAAAGAYAGKIAPDQQAQEHDALSATAVAPDYSIFRDENDDDEDGLLTLEELVAKLRGAGNGAFFSMGNAASNGKARRIIGVTSSPGLGTSASDIAVPASVPEPPTAFLILTGYITLKFGGIYLSKRRAIAVFTNNG